MIAALLALDAATPLALFSEAGSWLSLAAKLGVGGVVLCGTQYALWRLEGRPEGLERRLLQILSR